MGNPSYGTGYHQGSEDGFERGAGAGAVAMLTLVAVFVGSKRGLEKYKKYRVAKHARDLATEADRLDRSGEVSHEPTIERGQGSDGS